MTPYFIQAFIYLCAAVIAVPIAKRLGLGSVLGYLIAGVVIGPLTGLVGDETNTIQHFAEFGVVMMLFLVGLELEPRMLWEMRHRLLGLGGLQVLLTAGAICFIALQFGLEWRAALTVGFVFSLSSTAIVLQTLNEKHLVKTEGGRTAFSVLLFQDIAVIPMLALIPLLALPELLDLSLQQATGSDHPPSMLNLGELLPGWAYTLLILLVIIGLVLAGHFLSRPLFRVIANTELREIFTATALLLVISIAVLMSLVGLSPALGTFLAGVVMANSEFRHELEADIEPFKGLLLGLFFITVGAGIDFLVIWENLSFVLTATFGMMLVKLLILYLLSRLFRLSVNGRWLFTLSLAQAGEFGFVLLSFALQSHALPADLVQLLLPVVALSMFLTPALFILFDKVILPRYQRSDEQRAADEIDRSAPVIVAGIGRFGQIVNRLLVANGFQTVVLDHSANMINNVRKVEMRSYFGDATRPELLRTAGIHKARLLIIAIDDRYRANDLCEYAKKNHPAVTIVARAFDREHGYELRHAGADIIISETYHSALETASAALSQLGMHPFKVEQIKWIFRDVENRHDEQLYQAWHDAEEHNRFNKGYIDLFLALEQALMDTMQTDRHDGHSRTERGWTPPPKSYEEDMPG